MGSLGVVAEWLLDTAQLRCDSKLGSPPPLNSAGIEMFISLLVFGRQVGRACMSVALKVWLAAVLRGMSNLLFIIHDFPAVAMDKSLACRFLDRISQRLLNDARLFSHIKTRILPNPGGCSEGLNARQS